MARETTNYRMKIIREVEFEVTIPAQSRADAIRLVQTLALDYDDRDLKQTRIVSIHEEPEQDHVFDPSH